MLIMDPMHSVDLPSVEKEVDKQDHACIFLYLWAFILVFFYNVEFSKKKKVEFFKEFAYVNSSWFRKI